jgi:Maleate cis-trans isomerase
MAVASPTSAYHSFRNLPFTLGEGVADRAAIGVIVLASDQTLEHEWRQILGGIPGVGFYESRLWNDAVVTAEALAAMERDLATATRLILPGLPIDVMAFGCASGAIVIGEDNVFSRIRSVRPEVPCTTPPTAAVAAFSALGARRVALLTPYVDDINDTIRGFLIAKGLDVPVVASFTNDDDSEVARISLASIERALTDIAALRAVEAIYVSCTSLRLAGAIEELEAKVGLPILSSNHAMAWHALRLAGCADRIDGFGAIFRLGLDGAGAPDA